jgi:hypothetical protein
MPLTLWLVVQNNETNEGPPGKETKRLERHAEVKYTRKAESYRGSGSVSGLRGAALAAAWYYSRSGIDPRSHGVAKTPIVFGRGPLC